MTVSSDQQKEADFIMVLSSEMISDIVQRYLNDEMFKQQVSVVDTKPTESGYAFGICFTVDQPQQVSVSQWVDERRQKVDEALNNNTNGKRNIKGQHTAKEQK